MDEELFADDLHRVVYEEMREMGQVTARKITGVAAGTDYEPRIPGF